MKSKGYKTVEEFARDGYKAGAMHIEFQTHDGEDFPWMILLLKKHPDEDRCLFTSYTIDRNGVYNFNTLCQSKIAFILDNGVKWHYDGSYLGNYRLQAETYRECIERTRKSFLRDSPLGTKYEIYNLKDYLGISTNIKTFDLIEL